MNKKLKVLQNTTCYDAHEKHNTGCNKKNCKNWISFGSSSNCVILAARKQTYTLNEIGDIFQQSRMSICQTEKKIIKKLKASINVKED